MTFVVAVAQKFFDRASYYAIPQTRIISIIEELKINPFVGKSLGTIFLREKKIEDKRIYYLIFEDLNVVLLITASDKKTQKRTISNIKLQISEFREEAKKYLHK